MFHGGPFDGQTLSVIEPSSRIILASPMATPAALSDVEPFSPVELLDLVYQRRENDPSGAAYHYDFVNREGEVSQ